MRRKLYLIFAFSLSLVPLAAQAPPSARGTGGGGVTLWIGGSVSTFNPDYGCLDSSPFSCGKGQLIGVGPYFDTSPVLFGRIGLEGEVRLGLFHGPATLVENSYLGGLRARIFRYRNVNLAGKFLLGQGHLDVPAPALGGGNYFAYAPGATIDTIVRKHMSVRVEYEYQNWPGYKCFKCGNGGTGGLTPNGFSFGFGYAFHTPRYGEASY
jgi:hypothetical protein